jgi:hypothetical protein
MLGAALIAAGCRSDSVRAEQGRMIALTEHIDRLRLANNADKRALLERLVAVECHGVDACALKDLCVRAYQVHQRVLDSIASMQAAARGDAALSPELRTQFGRAEHDLVQAKTLTENCAEEQVRAVRKTLL